MQSILTTINSIMETTSYFYFKKTKVYNSFKHLDNVLCFKPFLPIGGDQICICQLRKENPNILCVYHKTGTKIRITRPYTCESLRLGNFWCLSYDEKLKIHRERETKLEEIQVCSLVRRDLAQQEECSSPIPAFLSLFTIISFKMQEMSGGQIFPPTLHTCPCVHKLYVLIQAFMHPSLVTKLYSFSSLSGLQNLKYSFTCI